MKVLVCGGRKYGDRKYLYKILNSIHKKKSISLVIQGGAWGADFLAEEWAKDNEVNCLRVPAKWSVHKKAAGPIRNKEMLEFEPDLVVAFSGNSGTQNMIKQARKNNIRVIDVEKDL